MSGEITLKIISPTKTVFDGKASMLSVTGTEGSLAIMKGHIPLATAVKPCEAKVHLSDGTVQNFNIGGGLLTVGETVTLLIDGN